MSEIVRRSKRRKRDSIQDFLDAAWVLYCREPFLTMKRRNQVFVELKPFIDVKVFKIAQGSVWDNADIADIKQEVYLEMLKVLEKKYIRVTCSVGEFTRYIHLVVRSACIEAMKKVTKGRFFVTLDEIELVDTSLDIEREYEKVEYKIEAESKAVRIKELVLWYCERRLKYMDYRVMREYSIYNIPIKSTLLRMIHRVVEGYATSCVTKGVEMRRPKDIDELAMLYASYNSVLPELFVIFGEEEFYTFMEIFAGQTVHVPEKGTIVRSVKEVEIWKVLSKLSGEELAIKAKEIADKERVTVKKVLDTVKTVSGFIAQMEGREA